MADVVMITAAAPGEHGAILVVGLLAVAMVGGMLTAVWVLTRWLGGIRPDPARMATYECGEVPQGPAWIRFNNRFAIIALVFVVFDVELALLLPILPRAMEFIGQGRGLVVFAEVGAFVSILLLGLVYVAAKGGFAWSREVGGGTTVAKSRGRGVAGSGVDAGTAGGRS